MITLKNINLSSIDLSSIDLRGIKLGLGGRGGGSSDGFPQLPGDVTRWHFGGLTNEMMAAMDDPRIEDADHKGRFLSFKNFAWGGMSGVGGYKFNFKNSSEWNISVVQVKEHNDNRIVINNRLNAVQLSYKGTSIKIVIKLTGVEENNSRLKIYDDIDSSKEQSYNKDGIYEIDYIANDGANYVYFYITGGNYGELDLPITIEQLPLYPGFILGDGVDDFAVTEKELNFEDTYTVYTAFIPFQNNPTRNMILCGADSKKTFSMQYSSLVYVSFIAGNNYYINADFVNGLNLFACKRNGNNICIKNLLTNKVVTGTCGDWVENAGLYYLWKNATYASFARAGIAGQIIDNGHFTTDEEDENILNWHKKQYPWLFPDQAWTVTGKTNEDEDRATIANITGNGNDLVLSNFGFAEGSGYGLYKTPFELYPSVQHSSKYSLSFSKFALGDHNLIIAPKQNDLSYDIKVKVTGLKDGVKFKWGWIGTTGYIDITTDGIRMLNKPASQIRQLIVEFAEDFDPDHVVTIEQIPEYEGYLITDGVDDEIISAKLIQFADKFTIVGDWKFMEDRNDNAGLLKANQIYIYNATTGMRIYLKQGSKNYPFSCKKINALTSDGWVYDEKWDKYKVYPIGSDIDISSRLFLGFYSSNFTKIALKNLGIYNDQLLSKDDCIKAYNYLQTLKAK